MTLKELSIELDRPAHDLANTLRQVGLADRLLSDDDTLTPHQINRLRMRKSNSKTNSNQKMENGNSQFSIASLAQKYNRSVGEMVNNVKTSRLMEDMPLSGDTILPKEVWDQMELKLNDNRIRLRVLAHELGVEPADLAQTLFDLKFISNNNWNQKIDKSVEYEVRWAFNQKPKSDEERELWELHEYLDKIESPHWSDNEDTYDEVEYGDMDEDDDDEEDYEDVYYSEQDIPKEPSHTVSSLATELGIAEERVINIYKSYSDIEIESDSPIKDSISEHIISEYLMILSKDQKRFFEEIYISSRTSDKWNNPVIPNNTRYYRPGLEVEGEVSGIDYDSRTITVRFRKITRDDNFLIFFKETVVIRPERIGTLSFDEWDWEISDDYKVLPKIGDKDKFLILSNENGNPLVLSRRQRMLATRPENGVGYVVAHHPEQNFICIRHSNGSYGFISYANLSVAHSFPLLSPGTSLDVHVIRSYSQNIQEKKFYYAEYDVTNDKIKVERNRYHRSQLGLTPFDLKAAVIDESTSNLITPSSLWINQTVFSAKIISYNKGGFLLKSLGEEAYDLFCPFSKCPTWIENDNKVHRSLVDSIWLVKIEKDPNETQPGNIIVSAKLNSSSYEKLILTDGFYEAMVCSCNEKGANVLVENVVPLYIPNKYVSYKPDSNALSDLQIGKKYIVKILSGDRGLFASVRDASIDPWKLVRTTLPAGTVLEAMIIHKEKDFVRLDLGDYIGHLHTSEISWTEWENPDCNHFAFPDPLRVVVTGYHDKSRTVKLSLRQLTVDPWTQIDKYLPEDKVLNAEIFELTNGGAYLKVGEIGFKGYLSYREVDWCRYIDKNSFPHPVGSKIEIKVIHVSKERRMLTCSLKALTPNPWEELRGVQSVMGMVLEVHADFSKVRIQGNIECICREALKPEYEGQILEFQIQQLNVAAQQIIISYRKREVEVLNHTAVGEMFKEYRLQSDEEKKLIPISAEGEGYAVYREFRIKEVSSTGRVTAVYEGEDLEYQNGILLPGSVTIGNEHVNIIFARQIIKQHIRPGEVQIFKVTHHYEDFNYAVLSIDVTDLLDLDHISTEDMAAMTSREGVCAHVLSNICTKRNIFVMWNGYYGYIPRSEILKGDNELPEFLRVKAVSKPRHPENMIRFALIDEVEEKAEEEELEVEQDIAEKLDADLFDCYNRIKCLDGFNPKIPDFYPFALQMRFNPEQHSELSELINSDPTYFSRQTFFLDCTEVKNGKGYILTIFNNNISLGAFCKGYEETDEIRITKFNPDVMSSPDKGNHYRKPLKISGDNLQIIPLNSSALPPDQQDMEIVMDLLKYNREVLPELRRLSRGDQQQRGEHYLTLQDLLRMDLDREKSLCSKEIQVQSSSVKEDAGSLGGYAIEFEADSSAFDDIISKDDPESGIQIYIKPNDGVKIQDKYPDGVLRYIGARRWLVELYPDRDLEIEDLRKFGIQIKRYPNVRHLSRQIMAIDNFVYERYGLDIFSKIARNKLRPIVIPNIDSIDANVHFNLQDLNDSQANALKMALGGSEISLIQGPPGTGKSTVIVDIIRNLVKQHKKVLVCTQSVAPVEELYYKLSGRRKGKNVGQPVKVNGYALRCAYLRDDDSLEVTGSVDDRRSALKDMRILTDSLKKLNQSSNEQMLNEQTVNKFQEAKTRVESHHKEHCGEVIRKFSKDILPNFDGIENILSEYIQALEKEEVECFASEHRTLNLETVDVVFGTCIGVGVNRTLRDLHFDTLIIDEAGKANYAESLVPMMMADEYILVGDDKQLPPYTNSELVKELAQKRLMNNNQQGEDGDGSFPRTLDMEIEEIMEDVGKSLFGDLKPRLPESNQIMLSKQFRMHPEIGEFVSKLFYEGKVSSIPKAADRTLNLVGLESPIKFIDTSGMGYEVREQRQGMSIYNDGEIQVIEEKLLSILEDAVNAGKSVGILSPYGAQVMRMRQRFPKLKNHIFTIDSIQGEEYDIVVFSFVRNTRNGSLNFVDDLRRLNVSFSRAKCNLIMIGHLDTLKNKDLHKVDSEEVIAVYDEIQNKKVELVAHHGAMEMLYIDFPPESCPIVKDLDTPYHIFEGCRISKGGQFTALYKGKLLSMFNPTLKGLSKEECPQEFRAYLIGYENNKPMTIIEPFGRWLTKGNTLHEIEFSAEVCSADQANLNLVLTDGSVISLSVPNAIRFTKGMKVKVKVWQNGKKNKSFTVNPLDND